MHLSGHALPNAILRRGKPAWACLLAGAALIAFLPSAPARASGIVTNCTEAGLRTALVGGGSVVLACDSTITLTAPIVVAKDTVLDGTGHSPILTGSSTGTNSLRLFEVQPGASLTLRNLTLTGGRLVSAAAIDGRPGGPAYGAALYCDHATVSIEGCTFSSHQVTGGAGAAANAEGNTGGAGGPGGGAAIYNRAGQITITNSAFSGNSATGGTGGNGGAGRFGGNGRAGGKGGDGGFGAGAAIYNTEAGMVRVFDSLFSSNTVVGSPAGLGGADTGLLGQAGENGRAGAGVGAAIFNESGTVSVVNSTFMGNRGTGADGGDGVTEGRLAPGQPGSDGGAGEGAGIYSRSGLMSVTNCTFVQNVTVGGKGGTGGDGGTGGFGSPGGEGGEGGAALGSGIYNGPDAAAEVVNCTFSDNSVRGGAGGAGGIGGVIADNGDEGDTGVAGGAAVFNAGGVLRLRNSILANSLYGSNAAGSVSDEGFNLSSDASPPLTGQGSRNGVDPKLGSLTAADGLVLTLTLATNSPAIDAITAPGGNGGPPIDQRNAYRLEPYDIGAYESNGTFSRPGLQAQIQQGEVLLSWPVAGGFALQGSSSLTAANGWVIVTNEPSTVSGLRTLSVPPTNRAQFFRLAKP